MKHISVIRLTENIAALCNPKAIYLYNAKYNLKGELCSFKLCVVCDSEANLQSIEASIYLNFECDMPFDILLYHEEEFLLLRDDFGSFAHKIWEDGELLYEQKARE